ncbi:hypothetical protein LLDT2_01560 [Lactococcus lactis subsp. lactis bv. diacetylactis str. TIFN2]|uniref:Uncharacterized protein n=1 Tax=Lactococcus lactis subsp. lactis TaxID=1360 RepID=A0A1V0NZ50_LACLL|nr:hypothetical protein LLUC06_pB29 [Lactococcus lactis subsp. lactis]EQC53083.1 hypothetical protein LLDT2_01560 [Lactococcus lactis subsp. lactis bv. diacetylactis str. TIFN2]EQC89325.1 hypothetical protein LLDT4_12570 [Lactococcus lactis subsp. lactis bv. diacetylactis str. TIFN4]
MLVDYIYFFNTEKILNDNSYKLEDETYKGATAQNKQIEILTSLLDQQQRLALQDKKLLEGFCCKVFQKIYFSVKLRKKTERTE